MTDIIVIGAGPGGYVAAIRAAQLGFSVTCVEKRSTLGGTCLNEGCIPSKALLHSSALLETVRMGTAEHGIEIPSVEVNLTQMMSRKDKVVQDLTKGIDFLFKKNKITRVFGTAQFLDPQTIEVSRGQEKETLKAGRAIIIATGSTPAFLPHIPIDETCVVSSTGALNLKKIPDRMMVVGGGYIGLEMGSVWQRLGSRVTIVEFLDRLLPGMDADMGQHLHRALEKQGIQFCLSTKVDSVTVQDNIATVNLLGGEDFSQHITQSVDALLISVGRRPQTAGMNLENLGVKLNPQGCIQVSKNFKTNVPGIYAIGDVIPGPMLAHKAEHEGVALAEILAGQAGHVNYDVIPAVIYTNPECASVGMREEDAKAAGIPYQVGKFSFAANGRAKACGHAEGWVKILSHAETDRVLGTHILGPDAGTLIGEAALAQEFGASAEDIARTCHAHPTLNEALKEAALAGAHRGIHS